MGYTHYWTQTRTIAATEWSEICDDVQAILNNVQHFQGVTLASEYDAPATAPVINTDCIVFNGLGDDGHESFYVTRKRPPVEAWQSAAQRGWTFCKTARKPYDLAVVAILAYLGTALEHSAFEVSSDGRATDWLTGVEVARAAVPRKGNQVDIPRAIMANDRWCGPYGGLSATDRYQLRCCVDGRAYIMNSDDSEALYAFASHKAAATWVMMQPSLQVGYLGPDNRDRIRRQQEATFKAKISAGQFEGAPTHLQPPPFVRPNEFPPIAESYNWRQLIEA